MLSTFTSERGRSIGSLTSGQGFAWGRVLVTLYSLVPAYDAPSASVPDKVKAVDAAGSLHVPAFD